MREKEEREGLGKRSEGETSRAKPSGFVRRLDQETTSYFITNFPEEAKTTELWSKFSRYARVAEVYIPNKLDKQGRRFGFVKFRDVIDAVELLRKISNIWMGSFKIRVNLSKFHKNSEQPTTMENKSEGVIKQTTTGVKSFRNALVTDTVPVVV
jgi:RNA recognition motif-containing protein